MLPARHSLQKKSLMSPLREHQNNTNGTTDNYNRTVMTITLMKNQELSRKSFDVDRSG